MVTTTENDTASFELEIISISKCPRRYTEFGLYDDTSNEVTGRHQIVRLIQCMD